LVSFDQAPIERDPKHHIALILFALKSSTWSAWSKDTSAALGLAFSGKHRNSSRFNDYPLS
ncbi:MAG: hypothetical protein Q7T20_18085, partial [Saprospiraceae bacterium]|nr:hypothetical protein [Saprospiraceae bacterium]